MLATPEIDFRRTPVTLVVAAIAVALEVASLPNPGLRDYFYNDLKLGIWIQIWHYEWWRPVTTTLLHGGLIHALFNIYWLLMLGGLIENTLGSLRTLAIIVLSAGVSSLVEFDIDNYRELGQGVVGLSGVVYAMFGFAWIGRRRFPDWYAIANPENARWMVGWLVLCWVLTRQGAMDVANWAHVSGMILGCGLGLAMVDRPRRALWVALVAVGSAAVLSTMIALPGHAGYEMMRR